MERIRWILVAFVLLLSGNAVASRLLVLPLLAEGVEAERAARIQAAIVEATSTLHTVQRMAPRGPTFCPPTDLVCIGTAGRDAGADRVLHATVRPLGDSLSLLLLVVEARENGELGRSAEPIQPSQPVERVVRERVVGLLEPSRHVGSLWVEAPDGSTIFVDGEPRGSAPLAEPIGGLAPGQHMLRVVRGGAAEARAYVEIRFASVTRVRIEPRSDQVALEGFDEVEEHGEAGADTGSAAFSDAGRTHGLLGAPEWKWVLLGSSGLALVAGWAVSSEGEELSRERASLRGANGGFAPVDLGREASLRRSYERRQGWSTTLYVTGGLLAAGAGTLFVLDALPQGGNTTVELAATPRGLGLMGRF